MSELVVMQKNDKVEKRNVLNQMRGRSWTLQELRFFMLYLSKINARDPKTREVRFTLFEFAKIMDLPRTQAKDVKPVAIRLLQKIVEVPQFINDKPTGGYTLFQLFSRCRVEEDEKTGEWYIEFNAHDEALPLMFEFKEKYVTYEIMNVLRLKGVNQFRMYEILKQYEKIGEVTISVEFLRNLFDVKPNEYSRWYNFKIRVLDDCQKALEEKTDIKYTYEQLKKRCKITAVKFTIKKNDNMETQPTEPMEPTAAIGATVDGSAAAIETDAENKKYKNKDLRFLAGACDEVFEESQMEEIFHLVNKIVLPRNYGKKRGEIELARYDYLMEKYTYAKNRSNKKGKLFNYLKTVLEAEAKDLEASAK
jgi:plasmid replication initiation protein